MKMVPVVFCSIHDSCGWRITYYHHVFSTETGKYDEFDLDFSVTNIHWRWSVCSTNVCHISHVPSTIQNTFTSFTPLHPKTILRWNRILCFAVSHKKHNETSSSHQAQIFWESFKNFRFLGLPNHGIPVHVTSLEIQLVRFWCFARALDTPKLSSVSIWYSWFV